jgi:uncharacterized protein with ParB-like and HNH nuclease domain
MNNTFEIRANTATLLGCKNQDSTFSILNHQWEIPIFQRPYSWSEKEIDRLITDMFIGYWGNDENKDIKEEPIFIGTMQFGDLNKETNRRPIIDGQQRITTLLLLLNIFKHNNVESAKNLNYDLLQTKVFNGEQQKNLIAALDSDPSITMEDNSLNKYLINKQIIFQALQSQIESNEGELVFDWERFSNYILNKIYFVTIETKANLSKTLQIFETINATGLDLNGSDIFKVRFYEYLTRFENKDDSVFNDISDLYATIERWNQKKHWVTNMNGILDIYRYILIAKYDSLPRTLYFISVDAFYEGLFDLLLNNSKSEGFTNPKIKSEVKLNIEDIQRIIDIRYKWEERTPNSPAAHLSYYFIHWSRYTRYYKLIVVFLFQYLQDIEDANDHAWIKSETFTEQLNKLLFVYSIRFSRSINNCHTHVRNILEQMFQTQDANEIISSINEQLKRIEGYQHDERGVQYILERPITYNYKHKNLICRMSAMLDELNENPSIDPYHLADKIFPQDNKIDIEHIQAYMDENNERRPDVWSEWGAEINSLGNLVILDSSTNKSIGNKNFNFKKGVYKKNNLISIQTISKLPHFDKDAAIKRKDEEVKKLSQYLFNYERENI